MKHASEDIRKLAVHLYATEKYTQQQVAEIVGYHVNSVKNWLRIAEGGFLKSRAEEVVVPEP